MDAKSLPTAFGLLQRRVQGLEPCNDTWQPGDPYGDCYNPSGFVFSSLYSIIQNIYRHNPKDSRLWNKTLDWNHRHEATLTYSACRQIAEHTHPLLTWYPGADEWARLVAWKFPLFQLLATFPRPPSTGAVAFLVGFRLLGNPIGTLYNLLLKIASCQARAQYWKNEFDQSGRLHCLVECQTGENTYKRYERFWKAFTLIVDSYDEWGLDRGEQVRENLRAKLMSLRSKSAAIPLSAQYQQEEDFMNLCEKTASSLAADRGTAVQPIFVANVLFMLSVLLAFIRTFSAAHQSASDLSVFVNIEAHSIAYSALYFWVISVTLLGGLIGTSQTRDSIPRILAKFEIDLRVHHRLETPLCDHDQDADEETREFEGGIYSWQPRKWNAEYGHDWIEYIKKDLRGEMHPEPTNRPGPADQMPSATQINPIYKAWTHRLYEGVFVGLANLRVTVTGSALFATLVILPGTIVGSLISGRVPPDGLSCRHFGQWSIWTVWLVNFGLDFPSYSPEWSRKRLLATHLTKDVISTSLTLGVVFLTQWGIFNSCWCYTRRGHTALALPEIDPVKRILDYRIRHEYIALAILCILTQVAVPFLVFYVVP